MHVILSAHINNYKSIISTGHCLLPKRTHNSHSAVSKPAAHVSVLWGIHYSVLHVKAYSDTRLAPKTDVQINGYLQDHCINNE